MYKICPFMWFDTQAEEAANLYVSLFPGAKIVTVNHWGAGTPFEAGSVMSVGFEIEGQAYQAFNGGPAFGFTESLSFFVNVDTQDEVDALWDGLTAGGGEPGQCGWLKDRFGVSWQIIPTALGELLVDPDVERSGRAMHAMLDMGKIDIAALQAAADGR